METGVILRDANPADARELLDIYSPYVTDSVISFEVEPPSVAEFEKRIRSFTARHPWIVCEEAGELLGYAYAAPFKGRAAYDWSVESTVYVKRGHHRRGLGGKLYRELLERLRAGGIVNVVGGITLPNEASVGLHERLGFERVAVYRNIGFKQGKWWDVGFWQLELNEPSVPPPAL